MNIIGTYENKNLGYCVLDCEDVFDKENNYLNGNINKEEFISNLTVKFGSRNYNWNLSYHTDIVFSICYNHNVLGPIYIYEDETSDYVSLKFTEDINKALKFKVEGEYLRVVDHPSTNKKIYLVGVDEYHKSNGDTFFMLGTLNGPIFYHVNENDRFDYMILGDLEFCFKFNFDYKEKKSVKNNLYSTVLINGCIK